MSDPKPLWEQVQDLNLKHAYPDGSGTWACGAPWWPSDTGRDYTWAQVTCLACLEGCRSKGINGAWLKDLIDKLKVKLGKT